MDRARARARCRRFLPSLPLSTDNAAMIAAAGLRRFRAGVTSRRPISMPTRRWRSIEISARTPDRRRRLTMHVHTDYLWFNTKKRQEFVRITDEVAAIVKKSGVADGIALVSAMHITAGVFVNDWEEGLIHDFQVWLEKLAPSGLDYRHHQTGEDNADAHLKRTLMGHQVVAADHEGQARSRPVGAGLLRGVRRPAQEARGREGDGGSAWELMH